MTLILAAKNRTGITFCYDTLVHDACGWSGASTPREEPEHKVRDLSSLVALGMAGSFSSDGIAQEFSFWTTIGEFFPGEKTLPTIKEAFTKKLRLFTGVEEDTYFRSGVPPQIGILAKHNFRDCFPDYVFGVCQDEDSTEGTYHLLFGNETTEELKSVSCCCLGYVTPEIKQRLNTEYFPEMGDTELRKHLEDVLEFAKEVVNVDGETILGGKGVSRLDIHGYQELSFE